MERNYILSEPEIHLKGEQKKVYRLPSNGPELVKGSAGSGKTLVAIARARYLRNLAQQDMVALRVVMRLGVQIANPVTRRKGKAGYPFAVLEPAS